MSRRDAVRIAAALLILWFWLAGVTWNIRHPRCNSMTFITHLPKALLFQTEPGCR